MYKRENHEGQWSISYSQTKITAMGRHKSVPACGPHSALLLAKQGAEWCLVQGQGFEPWQPEGDRFTVCCD